MVETVSAQPPVVGQGAAVAAVRLEPGTELKARVEANLPGGIVRLAADDAKFDLKLPVRLPPGSDVIVTVSGNRSNPVIQVTTPQVLPGEPAPPVTALQPQETPPQSPVLPVRPSPGLVQVPTTSGQAAPATTQETPGVQTTQTTRVAAQTQAANQPLGQNLPVKRGADLSGAPVQQGTVPARQPLPQASSTPQVTPSAAQESVRGAQPDPAVGGARSQSGTGTGATLPAVAARPGTPASAPAPTPAQGSAGSTGQPGAPTPALTSVSTQPQAQASPTQSSVPVSGSPATTTGPQAGPQQAGEAVRQTQLSAPANPASATASAPLGTGETVQRPAAPLPQTNPVSVSRAQNVQQASPQLAGPPSVAAGTAAAPASATSAGTPGTAPAPQAPVSPVSGLVSGPVSGQVASGPAEPVGSAAVSPLPGPDKPAPAPVSLSGTAGSAAKQGVIPSDVTPSTVRLPANTAPAASTNLHGQAAAGSQSTGSPQAGESLRATQNYPYQTATSGTVQRAAGNANPNVTQEANPASQLARQAFQALGEQQSGLGNLFAQVGTLMSAQTSGKVSLPDPVVKAMQQILGLRLTSGQNLSASDLQQSIRLSGQFREANAALPRGGAPVAQADLKSVLISFRSLLQQFGAEAQLTRPAAQPKPPSRQDPPQAQIQQGGRGFLPGNAPQILQALLKDTDAALARVRMTQLVNTGLAGDERAQATSRPMDLVLELPLALGQETGILQMQIGRDSSGQGDEGNNEPAWRLRFAMDLTATGPVEAAVSLRGGGTYVSLWVDRAATFDSLKALEETMLASFADAGLDLQEFRLMRGLPPKAAARYGTLVDRQS